MTTYAITAATGRLGRLVVDELLDRGVAASDVVAIVRTPARAADLSARGVTVRHGDYARPETLPAALAGVDKLLLISGTDLGRRVAQHTAVIEAATAAGVRRIVYTSVVNADTSTSPVADEHRGTEAALRRARIPHTVLRNGWYTELYTDQLASYLSRGEILGAAGRGRISAAPRADFAAAAAIALLAKTKGNVVHELGAVAFSLPELAAMVSFVTGVQVAYRNVTDTELVGALKAAGLEDGMAAFLARIDSSIAAGDLETDRDDLARLLGRPATSLTDALRAAVPALAA